MSLFLGLDLGSTTSKAVLLDVNGEVRAQALAASGHDLRAVAERLRHDMEAHAEGQALHTVATGYGRALAEFADSTVTEITCHARGVRHFHGDARAVLDIGGQDSKAIRLSPEGRVEDFVMNDRCAAGTGSFLDVIAQRFERSLDDLSQLHKASPTPLAISSTCVVFAESEVVGLLSRGHRLEDVLAGVHQAIAKRVVTLLSRIRAQPPIYFAGGVARNETLRRAIEAESGQTLVCAAQAQFCGAVGAALMARDAQA